MTASITVSVPGIYTVTVTTPSGCTSTASATVTLVSSTTNITGNMMVCPGSPAVLTAGNGVSYLWSTGETTATINTSTVGLFTVTVTDLGGCTATGSAATTCCVPDGYTLIDATGGADITDFVSNGTIPSMTLNGMNLYIMGSLGISGTFSVTMSDILMAPDAEILIRKSDTLMISKTSIQSACDFLWNRIHVDTLSYLSLKNCMVRGAVSAVELELRSELWLGLVRFENNHRGVISNDAFRLNLFKNNTFNCTDSLLPKLGDPNFDTWAYAGMDLRKASSLDLGVNIVANNSSVNTFKNLNIGIRLSRSIARVSNCYFENIANRYPDIYSLTNGFGVAALDSSIVDVVGAMPQGFTTFSRCDRGVLFLGSWGSIKHNMMEANKYEGIRLENCINHQTDVEFNSIQGSGNGINLQYNGSNTTRMTIANNIVDLDSDNSVGILGYDNASSPGFGIEIKCNGINANAVGGILLNACNKYQVQGNEVNLQNSERNVYGIRLDGTYGNTLLMNKVNGTDLLPHPIMTNAPAAIVMSNSDNTVLSCNDMQNTYIGLLASAACGNSQIRRNTFNEHHFGLLFTPSLTLEEQGDVVLGDTIRRVGRGNFWYGNIGNYPGAAARNEGISVTPFGDLQGVLWINSTQAGHLPPSTQTPNANISQWLKVQTLYNAPKPCSTQPHPELYFCGNDFLIGNPGGGLDGDLSYEELVAQGLIETSEHPDEIKYWTERQLYEKLKEDPTLWQSSSEIEVFKTEKELTSIDDIYQLDEKKRAVTSLTESQASILDEKLDILNFLLDTIVTIDSTMTLLSDTMPAYIALKALKEIKSLQAEAIKIEYDDLAQNYANIRNIKAEDGRLQNAATNFSKQQEENDKIVNDIYFRTVARGLYEFSSSDWDNINVIAHECPIIGGPAVYDARSLYATYVHESYDDFASCDLQGIAYRKKPTESQEVQYSIAPNPTVSAFTLTATHELLENTRVLLYNTLGNLVFETFIPANQSSLTVNTENLSSGIYYCKVGNDFVSKVVLIKP